MIFRDNNYGKIKKLTLHSNNIHSKFASIKTDLKIKIKSFLEKNLLAKSNINEKEYVTKQCELITKNSLKNIEDWIKEEIPIECKEGLFSAINEERWSDIIEAFWQKLSFGTSGIRGKMISSFNDVDCERDLHQLLEFGIKSTILRGTNTINEIVIIRYAEGVAQYMKKKNMTKVVIGYDSRIMSKSFSCITAKIFLNHGFTVYLFDDANPLPELSFSIAFLGADLGIEITASHNDKRHNGFKIVTKSGAPPNFKERNEIANEIFGNYNKPITPTTFEDDDITQLNPANEKLVYLGGLNTTNTESNQLIEIHQKYIDQIKTFVFQPNIVHENASQIKIGFSGTNGTGSKIIIRLLKELGYTNIKTISILDSPNPLFPAFQLKQILDPSDNKTAEITIKEFIKQYGKDELEKLDILIFSDPDADRLGLITKVPKNEQEYLGEWKLIKANDLWTLILWYSLKNLFDFNDFDLSDRKNLFIVKSYLTSDSLDAIAKKFGIECYNGKVGFSDLSYIVHQQWKKGKINVGMFEESNGIGIASNPQIHSNIPSHIIEKDAALAAILVAEISAYAKSKNTSIIGLLNKLYLDPEIGYYATFRLDFPEERTYEGIIAEMQNRRIMRHVERIAQEASKKTKTNSPYFLAGIPISRVKKYSTGRYDEKFWKNFADEGIRFFLDSETNHITIRSSGTESKIRIFVQYKISDINEKNLQKKKAYGEKLVKKIANEVKNILEEKQ